MPGFDWGSIVAPLVKEAIGVAAFIIPEPGVPEVRLLKESEEAEVNTERLKLVRKLLDEVKQETPCPSCVNKVDEINREVRALEKKVVTQERVARLRENLRALLEDAQGDLSALTSEEEGSAAQRDTTLRNATGSSRKVGVATPIEKELGVMTRSGEQRGGRPVSGKTRPEQTDESYCLECVEGHTMRAQTELRHAIDRFRTAGEMTPGVEEKVRVAIREIAGIEEDVTSTKGADPKVSEALSKILDKSRWIVKGYGVGGKGLTIGRGSMEDLEALRAEVGAIQDTTYKIVGACPTCLKRLK
jgi:hypothetical protein